MAISEVTSQRSTNGGAASTSVSFVYPATPTQGNLLVAKFSFRTGATVTVVPSGWTLAGASSGTGNIAGCVIYWRIAGASEPTAHTWTLSASVKSAGVGAEYHSTTGWETAPNTQNNGAVGTAATINTGNVTTANTPELVVAVGAQDTSDALTAATTDSWIEMITMVSTGGPTSSRNRTTAAYRGASAADLDSAAGTFSETFTGTDTLAKAARIASFKPAAAGATEHERSAALSVAALVVTAGEFWSVFERVAALAATALIATVGELEAASTLDADFLTSSVTGAPAVWETQCLEVVRNDTEKYLEHDPVDQAKLYWRTEAIVDSHAIPADTDDSVFFRLVDTSGNILMQARWRNTTGNLRVRFQVATATPGTLADHDYTTNLALDTRYRIEGLWDSTGDVWAVRVDGNAVANGALTSTSATTSIDKVRIGAMGTGTAQTYYMDLVAGAIDDWIGSEETFTTHERSAALSASTALATVGEFLSVFERSGALDATTAIATTGQHDLLRAVALSAAGGIASTAEFFSVLERSTAVAATADIASAGEFFSIVERSASIAATAAIVSAGVGETPSAGHERSASLSASALIAALGQLEALRAASLAAAGGVAASGEFFSVLERSASITATSAIVTVGEIAGAAERSASLSATSSIQAVGQKDALRSASLVAVSGIATTGELSGVAERSASLAATSFLQAAGQHDLLRAVSLTATANIASSGSSTGIQERSIAISGASAIVAAGQHVHIRSVSISATSSIAALGDVEGIIQRAASLEAATSVQAAGERDLLRAASIAAASGIASGAEVVGVHERSVVISAVSGIESTGGEFATLERSAALSATGLISTTGLIPYWLTTSRRVDVLTLRRTGVATPRRGGEAKVQGAAMLAAVSSIEVEGIAA